MNFMKWSAILIAFLLLLLAGAVRSEDQIKVGLVFSASGRGGEGFNDVAFRGIEWAHETLGMEYKYAEPGGRRCR